MDLTTALLILFIVAMIAMHLRGHGGHGGHGGGHGHGRDDSTVDRTAGDPPRRDHAHV